MNTKKNGRAADTGATRTANRRAFAPNRKTPMRRVWTLAHIPANARAAIDREAAKLGISTGEAIARLIAKGVAA